ncbi:MAG: hypothetical protein ACWA5P_10645 [bacterium]
MNFFTQNQAHRKSNYGLVSKSNKTLNALIICALLLFVTSAIGQNIITIDNNPGSTTTYQTIQDAHDNATAGDIIYVQPSGTTYGTVTIDKSITIIGRSHSEPGKVSQLSTVIIRTSNVELKGLQLGGINYQSSGSPNSIPFTGLTVLDCEVSSFSLGEGFSAPTVTADDVTIRGSHILSSISIFPDATNVLISNNILTASQPISCWNTASTVISNNIFRYTSTQMIFDNNNPSGTLLLFNNMFIFTGGGTNSIVNLRSGDFNLSNNLTYSYVSGGSVTFQAGSTGSFTESNTLANADPLFTDVDNTSSQSFAGFSSYNPGFRLEDDLTLQAGSPALTGGGGGSEMGLYNNGFIYNTIGNPRGIPILDVVSYDGAVPKNGNINVTINAKAN